MRHGVGALTLFAFSSENWQRPAGEVGLLMQLFLEALDREVAELDANARAHPVHRRSRAARARARRAHGRGGSAHRAPSPARPRRSRSPTAAAGTSPRPRVGSRSTPPPAVATRRAIDEAAVAASLQTAGRAAPDLFIRTGGERRISNFLLWDLAYTELWFTDTLWPDFDAACFGAALADFGGRERRFGRVAGPARGG